jgi:glycosyltransferase involved in cell wall biosynthesis
VGTVHVVMPDGIDDPLRPSGGNVYDRQMCRELAAIGWSVHEHQVPGAWPRPDEAALAGLADVLGCVGDGRLVLVDGLVGSAAPQVLVPVAERLRIVVLVHMPLGARPVDVGGRAGFGGAIGGPGRRPGEGGILAAAAAVVTTSRWTRQRLLDDYRLCADRVHVVEPGVEPADVAPGTSTGGRLLCVGAVTRAKGHDVLLAALARVRDLSWSCVCAGALDLEPGFVDELRRRADDLGIANRVSFAGPLTGTALQDAYAAADVLLLPSRAETYAMVVTEALARGLPVVGTQVGGVPEALGRSPSGAVPGLLVAPRDALALGDTLRCWLLEPGLRQQLRAAARGRRSTLSGWPSAGLRIAQVLSQV